MIEKILVDFTCLDFMRTRIKGGVRIIHNLEISLNTLKVNKSVIEKGIEKQYNIKEVIITKYSVVKYPWYTALWKKLKGDYES